MILADTSAWVEYLRRTGSAVSRAVAEAIKADRIVTTEVVVMELLAGAGSKDDERALKRLLAIAPMLPVGGLESWEDAATISRACRDAGDTIAARLDCLVAAVAIRERASVLHADRDYDVIARHTTLRLAPV